MKTVLISDAMVNTRIITNTFVVIFFVVSVVVVVLSYDFGCPQLTLHYTVDVVLNSHLSKLNDISINYNTCHVQDVKARSTSFMYQDLPFYLLTLLSVNCLNLIA